MDLALGFYLGSRPRSKACGHNLETLLEFWTYPWDLIVGLTHRTYPEDND
jgi:hypothetical protein